MARASSPFRNVPATGHAGSTTPTERLVRLEAIVAEMRQMLDVQFTRIASMQAEIDHLTAQNQMAKELKNGE
jgi:hypothetical protein